MILARSSITLTWERDIVSVTWYYKLQASTASVPPKPTTDPPTGWTDTEPSYTEGSTNTLYICQKTTYTDGTFSYSSVSLSSSYEASKAAYNKSVAAQQAAQAAQDTVDNLQLGGRNLYIERDAVDGYINASTGGVTTMSTTNREQMSDFIPVTPGEKLIFQAWAITTATGSAAGALWMAYAFYNSEQTYLGSRPAKYDGTVLPDDYTYNIYEITVPAGAAFMRCSYRRVNGGRVKVERGNIPTDWTPAPEDTTGEINDSAELVKTFAESIVDQMADQIQISISTVTGTLTTDIQETKDSLAETNDSLTESMEGLSQRVTDQEDALLDYKHQTSTYFRFNVNGLNIGKQEDGDDSPFSINIDNEKMGFLQNGQEIAYVQYNKMHINAIEAMDRLSVGAAADGGYFDFISTEYGMGIKWRAVTNTADS